MSPSLTLTLAFCAGGVLTAAILGVLVLRDIRAALEAELARESALPASMPPMPQGVEPCGLPIVLVDGPMDGLELTIEAPVHRVMIRNHATKSECHYLRTDLLKTVAGQPARLIYVAARVNSIPAIEAR